MKPEQEPKPQAVVTEREQLAQDLVWTIAKAISHNAGFQSLPVILAAFEKIEAQAKQKAEADLISQALKRSEQAFAEGKREGAREALEIILPFDQCHCRSDSHGSDSRAVGQEHWGNCLHRICEAIRALAAEPEVKPPDATEYPPVIDLMQTLKDALAKREPPQAPSKAEEPWQADREE